MEQQLVDDFCIPISTCINSITLSKHTTAGVTQEHLVCIKVDSEMLTELIAQFWPEGSSIVTNY